MNSAQDLAKLINKELKYDAVYAGGSATIPEFIPTEIPVFDAVAGGFAKGRITELYGQEQTGKSMLCHYASNSVTKSGGNVLWIDAEGAYDEAHSRLLGFDINPDRIVVAQHSVAEDCFDLMKKVLLFGRPEYPEYKDYKPFDLIVVDSVATLVPKTELDSAMADLQMGLIARVMGKGLRAVNALNKNTAIVFINQLRGTMAVGPMARGNETVTPGGKALKFAASQRILLRRSSVIKRSEVPSYLPYPEGDKDEKVGQEITFRLEKSRFGTLNATGSFKYYANGTLDLAEQKLAIGRIDGTITKKNNITWVYKDQEFRGQSALLEYLHNE